ncbi:hypothetical protein FRC00_004337 [Tulasnella sp. 408]|nr:hypothetical protein FRC00_004337 [Tulasnella sp. 408]
MRGIITRPKFFKDDRFGAVEKDEEDVESFVEEDEGIDSASSAEEGEDDVPSVEAEEEKTSGGAPVPTDSDLPKSQKSKGKQKALESEQEEEEEDHGKYAKPVKEPRTKAKSLYHVTPIHSRPENPGKTELVRSYHKGYKRGREVDSDDVIIVSANSQERRLSNGFPLKLE